MLGTSGTELPVIFLLSLNLFTLLAITIVAVTVFLKGSDYLIHYKERKITANRDYSYYLTMLAFIINDVFDNIVEKAVETQIIKANSSPFVSQETFDEIVTEVYKETLLALSPDCRRGLEMMYDASYVNIYIYKEIEKLTVKYGLQLNLAPSAKS